MTDSMKFGPEWLRTGGSGGGGGGTTTLSTPRYQLAEHRYGREEMLALFDRNYKPPEPLTTFPALYVEKTQPPLALVQMTEDETRMWNGGITNIGSRGRGSSVDRGRGRTGRGGLYSSHYSRGVGFGDDSGDGIRIEGQSFQGRNRPFDRSQSERGWPERNGAPDPGEWNGSTSPRKELSRGTSGSSLMESNWRRHRGGGEDDDGWRKWGRSSWREGGSIDRDRLDRNDGDGEESRGGGSGRWEHRGNHRPSHDSSHHPPPRTARAWESNHHDNHDNLPEWATENPSESGGSFDASGAFHGGMYSDDDEDGVAGASQQGRTRRVSEGSASNIVKSNNKTLTLGTGSVQSLNRHTNNTVGTTLSKERSKPLDSVEDKDNSIGKERKCNSPSAKPPVASTTEDIPAKILTTPSDLLQKKTVIGSANVNKVETSEKPDEPPSGTHDKENIQPQEVKKESQITVTTTNRQIQAILEQSKLVHNSGIASIRQRSEDDYDRMKEEADALVAKLMADEESHKEKTIATGVPSAIGSNQPSAVSSTSNQEKWYYRDPQGEVQGPFLASEMAEWCKAGYFTTGLLVRRTCDERYATLGDLIKMYGRVPFTPGLPIPPLKLSEQMIPPVPTTIPAGLAASAIPKTGIEDPILLMTYQQMQMMHNQQMLLRQMRTSAIAKLSQSEHWTTLSPVEQNQLILQYVIQDGMQEIPEVPIATNPFVPHLASQTANPVMQLFTQMQQAKTQPETHLPTNPHATASSHPATVDPLQQLIQQMGNIQNLPTIQQPNIAPTPAPTQEDNPIKSLLRQLNVNTNGHPQAPHMDTVWPQPPPQIAPQFNAQNWLAQVGPIPAMPPGQLPGSLWDLHAKDMKTEQQILEEQNLKLQEDRKKEELKKQEELQRQAEEENAKRKQKEEEQARQVEEAKRKDEERKKKEEEKKRKEEEKRKQEEEQKKREEKKRKEEEKRREEKRKQEEENLKRKQEEERRKREELKKQEEKLKKEEEKRKKMMEEEQKKEEERLRKEVEVRRQVEAEEQARRTEQRRREAEALRKLQERNKAPWAQTPRAMAPAAHTASLAEIQRFEREKKVEEQRLQQMMQQQLAQQKAIEAAQEASATDSSKRLQFKWAEKATASNKPLQVKSLAQIQQEEQEHIAKVKQQERERQEKAGQKESASMLQNAGIWGTASQCLNWANSSTNSQAWSINAGNSGFWDDPAPVKSSATVKQPATKQTATSKSSTSNQQQQQQQQPQQNSNNKASKSKNKREEELVKKLFEQNTAKPDDFTQWCNKTLSGIQASVDIPTFVGFLRDIESAYEVKEYVRVYLGDTKQSTEFAKQFLEKRSKWRSAQRPQAQADDLCKPAPAVNPNASAEFQEVKGKSKKPKKGKMFKVDNRILGFSVTAAPDRINVGDRDYGEGV